MEIAYVPSASLDPSCPVEAVSVQVVVNSSIDLGVIF